MLSVSDMHERSQMLHREALALLDNGVLALLEAQLGRVHVAGSVQLDMMAVPDIDLYAALEPDEAPKLLAVLPLLALELHRQGYSVASALVRDEYVVPDPKFPTTPGLYLMVKFLSPRTQEVWKLDLWGWNAARMDAQHARHAKLLEDLRGVNRDLVLRLKHAPGYGQRFFSVDVYEFARLHPEGSLEAFLEQQNFGSSLQSSK
jgi:hypothetical protein